MSEIKLNLIDSQTILSGTIHGSIGDRCVAALSAEPETILELEAALVRFERSPLNFSRFFTRRSIDPVPYDAGILLIDLAARIVACDSTYSLPGRHGCVEYHDGTKCTDIPLNYRLPDDWLFLNSVEEYEGMCDERRQARAEPLDARAILYGPPLFEFIVANLHESPALQNYISAKTVEDSGVSITTLSNEDPEETDHPLAETVRDVHRRWLLTPRDDLRAQSPRQVLLAKQDLINSDLDSRIMQWSIQLEGPPGLDRNSFAYRFAGFGTHEWVVYYDLVRHLIWRAAYMTVSATEDEPSQTEMISAVEKVKSTWLNEPNEDFACAPISIIDNERRRLPEAMGGRNMVIDEDCPLCKMMGDESEAGLGVYFTHYDGCNMDDEFAFSTFPTLEAWETDHKEMEARHEEFDRKWKERQERLSRGEVLEPDPFFDLPELDEFIPWPVSQPDPPAS